MSKHSFASIIFKLLGFYILANNFTASLVSIVPFLSSPQDAGVIGKYKFVITIPILSYMFLGLVFIIFADLLANLIIKENAEEKLNFNFTADDLQRVLFSYLGLYLIVFSLPQLISIAINMFTIHEQAKYLNLKVISDSVGAIVKLILGISVFFGSKGLVGLLKAIRYSGSVGLNTESKSDKEEV